MASIPGKRRFHREALFALLAGSLFVGCGSKGCACTRLLPKEEAKEKAYTDVEMLSAGGEPKVTLRVARWSGLRYRLTLEVSGTLGFEGAPPVVGPTTTMVVDNEVLRGSADPLVERQDGGVVRLIEERSIIQSIRIRQPGMPQPMVDFWNQVLLPMRGTSYLVHVAESAAVASLNSELLGGTRPPEQVTKALNQALDGRRHFPFRLPPASVGVGARWRFREALDINGAHAFQIAEMTLRSIDANIAVVGVAIRQDAPSQVVPHPFLPGATATLEQFRGDGGGELIIDRLTAIPVREQISITARSTLSSDIGGQHNVATLVGATTVWLAAGMLGDEDAGPPPEPAVSVPTGIVAPSGAAP